MGAPDPRDYPVVTSTLLAPLVAWLAARYLPGLELDSEQATIIAGGILAVGSLLATNLVRSRRSLPDPDATKANTVRVEPTTVRLGDDDDDPLPSRKRPQPRG